MPAIAGVLLVMVYPLAVAFAFSLDRPVLAVALSLVSLAVLAGAAPRGRRAAVMVLLAFVVFIGIVAGRGTQLSYLPPIVINLGLAGWFGATLRAGREPLVSRFARIERGILEPDLDRYTRTLTWVWTAFFLTMAAVSATLATLPSPLAWTWFTAVGNWVCVAALFLGEYLYRRARFGRYAHAAPGELFALVRAQWRTPG
jgi:uncharacterized membrane protein